MAVCGFARRATEPCLGWRKAVHFSLAFSRVGQGEQWDCDRSLVTISTGLVQDPVHLRLGWVVPNQAP
jgi:hypothetical protein